MKQLWITSTCSKGFPNFLRNCTWNKQVTSWLSERVFNAVKWQQHLDAKCTPFLCPKEVYTRNALQTTIDHFKGIYWPQIIQLNSKLLLLAPHKFQTVESLNSPVGVTDYTHLSAIWDSLGAMFLTWVTRFWFNTLAHWLRHPSTLWIVSLSQIFKTLRRNNWICNSVILWPFFPPKIMLSSPVYQHILLSTRSPPDLKAARILIGKLCSTA